jgi:hypothetical protein
MGCALDLGATKRVGLEPTSVRFAPASTFKAQRWDAPQSWAQLHTHNALLTKHVDSTTTLPTDSVTA